MRPSFLKCYQKVNRNSHFDFQVGIYLLLSLLLFFSNKCYSLNCKGFYQKKPSVEKIDTNKNEMVLRDALFASIKKGSRSRDVESAFDLAVLGPLGRLYEISWHDKENKFLPIERPEQKTIITKELNELMGRSAINFKDQTFVQSLIDSGISISQLSDAAVVVTSKNIQSKTPETPLDRAIRSHFNLLYAQMANWSYRLSGLEKNRTSTSMIMLDEISMYAKNLRTFSFNLAFDQAVWREYLKVLEVQIQEYKDATTETERDLALSRLSQPSIPFLPFAGLSASVPILDRTQVIELKRYFKNDLEDPLGLVSISKKDDFILRHRLIYETVQSLPENSLVEIHAHSLVHARAYVKLGFKVESIIINEKYPNIEIRLLQGRRENILQKIKSILDKMQ